MVLSTQTSKQPPWPMDSDSRTATYKAGTTEVLEKSEVLFYAHIY